MFNETTFNSRDDDSAPAALANGSVHLPDNPTAAEIAAAQQRVIAMASNPRVCAPEEIEALYARLRDAQDRQRDAQKAADLIEFALPPELRQPGVIIGEGVDAAVAHDAAEILVYTLCRGGDISEIAAKRAELSAARDARAAALAAAGHAETEALAAELFIEMDAIELGFVRLVPTTLATVRIFAELIKDHVDRFIDERDCELRHRLYEGLEIMTSRTADGN